MATRTPFLVNTQHGESRESGGNHHYTEADDAAFAAAFVVTKLNSRDVLMGRGAPLAYYEGNVTFRDVIVQPRKVEYCTAKSQERKQQIAKEVYDELQQSGGRFLAKMYAVTQAQLLGVVPLGEKAWYIVSVDVAMEKIKQALREKSSTATTATDTTPVPAVQTSPLATRRNGQESFPGAAPRAVGENIARSVSVQQQHQPQSQPRGGGEPSSVPETVLNVTHLGPAGRSLVAQSMQRDGRFQPSTSLNLPISTNAVSSRRTLPLGMALSLAPIGTFQVASPTTTALPPLLDLNQHRTLLSQELELELSRQQFLLYEQLHQQQQQQQQQLAMRQLLLGQLQQPPLQPRQYNIAAFPLARPSASIFGNLPEQVLATTGLSNSAATRLASLPGSSLTATALPPPPCVLPTNGHVRIGVLPRHGSNRTAESLNSTLCSINGNDDSKPPATKRARQPKSS